jgi:asparagine synthase (glutamine-hydrolysing)
MCGIFGAVGWNLATSDGRRALATLRHRGPDATGSHADSDHRLFLGHTRLSIIDLSEAGAQPMFNEDRSLALVLNGEIYNHEELRASLMEKGHRFRGRCDAEVVLHLYEELGMDLLPELHGMFAFALYDTKKRALYLARDRLGIKPLYWHEEPGRFAFASELKAIRALPGLDLEADVTAWYDFLTYQFVPGPKTIFRRTRKLLPAHWLEHSDGKTSLHRWWEPRFEPEEGRSEADALDELEALATRVIREHLVSDVPVGIFLSGGVDSSLVAAWTRSVAERPLDAFTIAFPEKDDDEASAAVEIAKVLGSKSWVGRFSTEELRQTLPLLPEIFDEPFADHSALPMILLCRYAGSQLKVVLSGDGGDETHLGYGRYLKAERRRALYAFADALPGLGALGGPAWLRNAAGGQLGRDCHFHGGIPREAKRRFLEVASPELRDYDDYWLLREHSRKDLPPYARQQALDLETYLPDGILTKVDRTAMRFGLEVRPPLLDHRMVEFAARLPDSLKFGAGAQKLLLRRALSRKLPTRFAWGKKRGFSVPIKHFIRAEGFFRMERDLEVFDAFRIRHKDVLRVFRASQDSQKLWIVWVLDQFVRAHGGAGAPQPPS